jgi:DNA-binding response OmpR family regulator
VQLLIAHRDSTARAAIAKALAGDERDLDVIESDSGEEVLKLLLADHAPRLAVIDWDMPGIDGPEICRLARSYSTVSPPYVVLLAGSHHPDVDEGLEAGAGDCIRIPARASDVRDCVDVGRCLVQISGQRASSVVTLEAVLSRDTDDAPWGVPEDCDEHAGASRNDRIELQTVVCAC